VANIAAADAFTTLLAEKPPLAAPTSRPTRRCCRGPRTEHSARTSTTSPFDPPPAIGTEGKEGRAATSGRAFTTNSGRLPLPRPPPSALPPG